MTVNTPDPVNPAERLSGMLGGRLSPPQAETVPDPVLQMRVQAPPKREELPQEAPPVREDPPVREEPPMREERPRREEQMFSEATPVARLAQAPERWQNEVSDAEKIRVLEGFHRWVVDKIAGTQRVNDDALALQQAMHEIVGAAGFITTLLSDGR
jgi:hypothetical protein